LINKAVEIAMNPAQSEDIGFMNKALVQANLPHSKPKTDVWVRKNGRFSLVVQAGLNAKGESLGLPYGTIPRLGLLYIITKAIKTQSRHIELGASLAGFMRELGLNPDNGTGAKSDSKRMIEQMKRLFNARFSFTEELIDSKGNTGERCLNMQVSNKNEFWWNVKNTEQISIFSSWLELGEDFF
jgi:Plasmid encoded RepA protein.